MADFQESIKQLSARINDLKDHITTEEATKTSFVLPFFQLMGYDIFNPHEFLPEFTADVGIKKGEKVDYAIIKDSNPVILIECKCCTENLTPHDSQLFRYFGTTKAKFSILTNGIIYKFYTDLEQPNKMDEKPFLELDLLDLKKNQIPELMKFQKSGFDVNTISSTASELKYMGLLQNYFSTLLKDPTDDFIRFLLSPCYEGQKNQNIINQFKPIVKRAINQYINDMMNEKISSALENENMQVESQSEEPNEMLKEEKSKINTTAMELECYFIIKGILSEIVAPSRIVSKDTETYFGILLDGNIRKWICRLFVHTSKIVLQIPGADKSIIKIELTETNELFKHKKELLESVQKYL
ncbi:MAG: type I restriction endonuclease [Saccharofermentanales bacterium]